MPVERPQASFMAKAVCALALLAPAVQSQSADDRAIEVAHQPVGEEEGPGPFFRYLMEEILAGEHLVAVRTSHLRSADLFEDRLQATVGATVSIDDDQPLVSGPQRTELLAKLLDDPGGVKVEHRG